MIFNGLTINDRDLFLARTLLAYRSLPVQQKVAPGLLARVPLCYYVAKWQDFIFYFVFLFLLMCYI